ncbi:hypothetical protein LA080_008286 [Diaporthe eres]|nr:hypothetical protein LA080_008286 [Diaporthe eres]
MAFIDLASTETLKQVGAARKNESQQRNSLITQVLRNYMIHQTIVILTISPLEANSRQSRITLEFSNKISSPLPNFTEIQQA